MVFVLTVKKMTGLWHQRTHRKRGRLFMNAGMI